MGNTSTIHAQPRPYATTSEEIQDVGDEDNDGLDEGHEEFHADVVKSRHGSRKIVPKSRVVGLRKSRLQPRGRPRLGRAGLRGKKPRTCPYRLSDSPQRAWNSELPTKPESRVIPASESDAKKAMRMKIRVGMVRAVAFLEDAKQMMSQDGPVSHPSGLVVPSRACSVAQRSHRFEPLSLLDLFRALVARPTPPRPFSLAYYRASGELASSLTPPPPKDSGASARLASTGDLQIFTRFSITEVVHDGREQIFREASYSCILRT